MKRVILISMLSAIGLMAQSTGTQNPAPAPQKATPTVKKHRHSKKPAANKNGAASSVKPAASANSAAPAKK